MAAWDLAFQTIALSLVNIALAKYQLDLLLGRFLGPYGIRSLSRYHAEHPYSFWVHGEEYRVGYLPAEPDTGMFGGNSNWRGRVWFPINVLLIHALLNLYAHYGDGFTVECPTGSGRQLHTIGADNLPIGARESLRQPAEGEEPAR